ncbi:MAG: carbon-nitrogen hydrolase family protein [Gammaproteobacteria bacterium]|jgi:predicted amidohydrolase|nr:carbon-nitrogen hydrolase family protein [Gammaproteobacteria bacterium]|tara:strand:- start:329 stop:1180 length:852 start_codon:yes stop_codon:yes gene_type:complete
MTNKVSAIQMVSTANIDENLNTAARLIAKAVEGGARLVLLPEVFAVLEGGPMRQFGEIEGDPEAQLQNFLSQQASKHQVIIVGGTIPLISRPPNGEVSAAEIIESERVRSACLVFDESGAQIARYDKIHLFDVIVNDEQSEYSESRSYEPGVDIVSVDTSVGNLGLSICYDMRFPELYRALFQRGAELVTVPAAFTKVTGEAHWESLLRARAIENQCYVIAAGQGGRHSQTRETWGHSMIIDPWGTVLAMVEEGEGVATAEINLEFVRNVRARMPIREQQKLS